MRHARSLTSWQIEGKRENGKGHLSTVLSVTKKSLAES
jgi:hypothetical protein